MARGKYDFFAHRPTRATHDRYVVAHTLPFFTFSLPRFLQDRQTDTRYTHQDKTHQLSSAPPPPAQLVNSGHMTAPACSQHTPPAAAVSGQVSPAASVDEKEQHRLALSQHLLACLWSKNLVAAEAAVAQLRQLEAEDEQQQQQQQQRSSVSATNGSCNTNGGRGAAAAAPAASTTAAPAEATAVQSPMLTELSALLELAKRQQQEEEEDDSGDDDDDDDDSDTTTSGSSRSSDEEEEEDDDDAYDDRVAYDSSNGERLVMLHSSSPTHTDAEAAVRDRIAEALSRLMPSPTPITTSAAAKASPQQQTTSNSGAIAPVKPAGKRPGGSGDDAASRRAPSGRAASSATAATTAAAEAVAAGPGNSDGTTTTATTTESNDDAEGDAVLAFIEQEVSARMQRLAIIRKER